MTSDSVPGFETRLQSLIDCSHEGDAAARESLLVHAGDRLQRLTRSMFRNQPSLHRWEQTDDVFQDSLMRLHRALADVKVESVRHFFNLAALQVRRVLLDMAKKHYGPEGIGANHHTNGVAADEHGGALHDHAVEPEDLARWTEFHAAVEQLPPEEVEVFNLLYYEGLTQEEAAKVLGISFRTLKRRWQAARVRIHEAMNGD